MNNFEILESISTTGDYDYDAYRVSNGQIIQETNFCIEEELLEDIRGMVNDGLRSNDFLLVKEGPIEDYDFEVGETEGLVNSFERYENTKIGKTVDVLCMRDFDGYFELRIEDDGSYESKKEPDSFEVSDTANLLKNPDFIEKLREELEKLDKGKKL